MFVVNTAVGEALRLNANQQSRTAETSDMKEEGSQ